MMKKSKVSIITWFCRAIFPDSIYESYVTVNEKKVEWKNVYNAVDIYKHKCPWNLSGFGTGRLLNLTPTEMV